MQPTIDTQRVSQAVIANAIINPPTAYPQITVGGSPFELRFSLTSSFHLETKCDIAAQDLVAWIASQVERQHFSSMLTIVTSAMLGHQQGDDWVPTPMMPLDFSAKITRPEWEVCMASYTDAISKAAAAVVKALTPPTPPTSEPIQIAPVN